MSERTLLTRIIAVNWYGFTQIIDLEKTTLISGAFGTGKSALLDLIQHVMLGDGWKANRAASGKARGRDLVGYCLCDTNFEKNGERHFLRPSGATVIALEFTRPAVRNQEPDRETWGLRIEYSNPTAQPKKTHFCLPERLEYDSLLDGQSLLEDERFRTWIRREYGPDCLFGRQQDYLAEMATARHLYFDGKSFRMTFPKAIAFEPEDNVEKFIREFILEESPLQIAEVRESLQAYEDVRRRLAQQEDEAGHLREIVRHHESHLAAAKQAAILEHVEWMLQARQQEEIRDRHQAEITRLEQTHAGNRRNLKEKEDKAESVGKLLEEANRLIHADPEAGKLVELKDRSAKLEAELRDLTEARKSIQQFLRDHQQAWADWLRHGESLGFGELKTSLEAAGTTLADLAEGSERERLALVAQLGGQFSEIWEQTREALEPLKRERSEIEKHLRQIDKDLDRLKKEQTPGDFPIYEALQEQFGDKVKQLGREIEVNPRDEKWWAVLESLLANERWLIVPADEQVYAEALPRLPQSGGSEREALLNSAEVDAHGPDTASGGLLDKLEICDPRIRARLTAFFGDIVCAGNAQEAEAAKARRAVSPDGYFKDAPVRRMLPVEGVSLTMGKLGLRRMEECLLLEQTGLSAKRDKVNRRIDDANVWLNGGKHKGLGGTDKSERSGEIERIPKLETELGTTRETIKLIETPERMDLLKRHEELAKERDRLVGEIGILKKELSNFETTLAKPVDGKKAAEEALQECELRITESRVALSRKFAGILDDELTRVRDNWMNRGTGWNERFEALLKERSGAEIKASTHKHDRNAARRDLQEARNDDGSRKHPQYATDFDLNEEGNEAWAGRLKQLENVELESNRALAESRKQEWQKRLQEQVLNELTRRMQDAEAVIKSLRRHLSQPVGNYRYEIKQKRDLSGYGNLWQLLDTGFEGTDPLAQAAGEPGIESAMEELMAAVHAWEDAKEKAVRLLDYRNYHRYDIEMIPVGKETSAGISLSRSSRNLSGGESQAPFFISMLAAFRRVYDRGDHRSRSFSQIGLVVMDEAFSKLSSDGIEDCLALARSFGLQLVLAFPPEKLGVMINHAQTVIVCQKQTRNDGDGYPLQIENFPIRMTIDEALEALE
ncbi:MAG: hypothetical protein LAT58_08750 [Opitutales bacterium]|nr:hypothetical protein [Opitutales bacterium]